MPATRCPRCGSFVGAGDSFCPRCGAAISPSTENYTPGIFRLSGTSPYGSGRRHRPPSLGRVVVGLLVLAVVVAVIVVVATSFRGGGVYVVVSSSHITNSVEVTLTIDGSSKWTQSLAPGYQIMWSGTITWFGENGCTVHSVVATSTGGALGPTSAAADPTVCQGQTVEVDLAV